MPNTRTYLTALASVLAASASSAVEPAGHDFAAFAGKYCVDCHNPEKKKGKFDLESLLKSDPAENAEAWDEVLWMIQEREMPPEDEEDLPRPSEDEFAQAASAVETQIARAGNAPDREIVLSSKHALISQYCLSCHNADDQKGDFVLEGRTLEEPTDDPEFWETVIRRLHARQMPPPDRKRPNEASYQAALASLVDTLDASASSYPKPGRTETFRRLNRTEYQNAIRDLLGVQIDAAALLPNDEASHGFDNITVGNLSPTLLDRYITAARKISRLAVGAPLKAPELEIFRIPAEVTQEKRMPGLPLGTQGGALVSYNFPRDGEYEIEVRLSRDRNEHVEGLKEPHEMDILLERELVERFVIDPPEKPKDHELADRHLKTRIQVRAGPRDVGVAFLDKPYSLIETKRMPHNAHFNIFRHPRLSPAVYQISITGPFESQGVSPTPSRQKIFVRQPAGPDDEADAAREIVSNLLRRAYRRPVETADLARPMDFYAEGAAEGGFESGIERALNAILVSPEFLFRIEREPSGLQPGQAYRIGDLELASRLSFFIWSSIPDDELIDLAAAGELSDSAVLEGQIHRMLTDPRSRSLVDNFASQWLYLRNLDSVTPDLRLYPDFDDNLRQAFRQETEMLFDSVLREDRSVLDLIQSDYTFLNERLAKHYGIPHIYGSRFRRVDLEPQHQRGGILRHGSILTVTSYATRTSPTIRGNWILENIIGTPPPPPPPNIPDLEDNQVDQNLPMRERLAEHRANPACASCHDLIDPIGFVLESYDAVGRWRGFEHGLAIDSSGGLPDGRFAEGIADLEAGLIARPDLFVRTLSEKLLTFALGRGVESHDAPAIRQIVRDSQADDYRFSSLITAIARSVPFQMRAAADTQHASTQSPP